MIAFREWLRRLPADRRSWVTSLVLAAGLCYLAWLTGCAVTALEFPWDDNFISYLYSRNFAAGHGLRYNIDDPSPTEGFSSLVHVLIVALGFLFGADPLVLTRGLSLVCFLVVPVILGLAFSKLLKAPLHEALAVACASQFFYFLTSATPYHLNLGMETVLFMASVACLAAWSLGELATGEVAGAAAIRRVLFGCVAVTLVALGRPEGPLVVALTLAVIPLARRFLLGAPWTGGDRAFLAVCGWTAVGLAAYLVWKQWYFGDVLPNPYYVKSHNAIMGSQPVILPGWQNTRAFLGLTAPWVALAFPLLAAAGRPRRNEIMALLAASLPGIIMVLTYAGAIHEAAFKYRYEFPFLVYLNLLLGGAACLLTRGVRWGATALLVAVTIGISFTKYPREIVGMKPTTFLRIRVDDSQSFLAWIGKDLARTRLGRRATIALSAAGAIPYLSGFRAIDLVGLNDSYLCGREPRSIQDVWAYIARHKPDVLQSGLPPATRGIGLDRSDPVLAFPLFLGILHGNPESELAKYYDLRKQIESMRREMIYIRDHFTFGAAYSPGKGKGWTILYLRKDSPHLDTIRQTLLSTSFNMDRTTDLSRLFGNDPRNLR